MSAQPVPVATNTPLAAAGITRLAPGPTEAGLWGPGLRLVGRDTARGEAPGVPAQAALWGPDVTSAGGIGEYVAGDPDQVQAWVHRFAQAVVEVVAGHRPPAQLVRWTTRSVFRDLERRTVLAHRAASSAGTHRSSLLPQVRSVHLCLPATGVVEAGVHVRHGHRSRAVAMRFELQRDRWTCTAVDFS